MKSFPFDSEVTYTETGEPVYDRASNSQELRDYFHLMYTDGVFPNPSTGLQVVAYSEEMSVSVLPGNVIIRGAFGIEESTRTLVFEAAGTAYDRIDAVVARLNTNYNYRKIDLYVVKGVESASPVAPELTREGGIYELRLANVFIAKNTTTITTERITDTRLNTDDCGIVTANPKVVDTTAIFDQYQASLDKYLKYVKECIDGTTAANLQNQIDEVNSNLLHKILFSESGWVSPTVYDNRATILDGGYIVKDGYCFINVRFQIAKSLNANSTQTIFINIPAPKKICPLNAAAYGISNEDLWLSVSCAVSTSGYLKYKSSEPFSNGCFSVIGFYKLA